MGVLPAYSSLDEACDDMGVDAVQYEGFRRTCEVFEEWESRCRMFYEEGHLGAYRKSIKHTKDEYLTPHDVMVALMYERALAGAGRLAMFEGSPEDGRLARDAGFMLPMISDKMHREELNEMRGHRKQNPSRGKTGIPSRPEV